MNIALTDQLCYGSLLFDNNICRHGQCVKPFLEKYAHYVVLIVPNIVSCVDQLGVGYLLNRLGETNSDIIHDQILY